MPSASVIYAPTRALYCVTLVRTLPNILIYADIKLINWRKMNSFYEAITNPLLLPQPSCYELTPASSAVAAFCRRLPLAIRTDQAGANTAHDAIDEEVRLSRERFDAGRR